MGVLNVIFGIRRARIGSITIDASIREKHSLIAEITDNPVEEGAEITDHVQLKPKPLTMDGIITDTPINFAVLDNITNALDAAQSFLGGSSRSIDAFAALEALWKAREPFTVVTGLKVYQNMVIETLDVDRSASTANSIQFSATLREIRIASSDLFALSESFAPDIADIANKTRDRGTKAVTTLSPTAGLSSSAAAQVSRFNAPPGTITGVPAGL